MDRWHTPNNSAVMNKLSYTTFIFNGAVFSTDCIHKTVTHFRAAGVHQINTSVVVERWLYTKREQCGSVPLADSPWGAC